MPRSGPRGSSLLLRLLPAFLLLGPGATLALGDPAPALRAGPAPSYHKHQLSDVFFAEGSTFADLDNDGQVDAIAGPFWYAGPEFVTRRPLYPAKPFDRLKYSDNFSAFPHDFNRDGWMDVLVLGFPGKAATWYQNPGVGGHAAPWIAHVVFDGVDNESPTFGDLLGTGQPVLICNHQKTFGYATFDPAAPSAPWIYHPVSPVGPWGHFNHGLGWGDINGDGRADLVGRDGWWEQPANLTGDPVWRHHPFSFGEGGAQMLVTDVNGDGLADVVTSIQAHGYGLSWFEQSRTATGAITFHEQVITPRDGSVAPGGGQFSQPHALALADLPPPISTPSAGSRHCSSPCMDRRVSSTHIAYGSIRMEPVFMMLGQSAATAATLAIDTGVSVQRVDYPTLREHLLRAGQILDWKRPPHP